MQRKRMNSKICGLWIISISLRRPSLLLLIALKSYKQPLYFSFLFFLYLFPFSSSTAPFPSSTLLSFLSLSHFLRSRSLTLMLPSRLFLNLPSFYSHPSPSFSLLPSFSFPKQDWKSTSKYPSLQILFSTSSFRILVSLFSNLALHLLSSRH